MSELLRRIGDAQLGHRAVFGDHGLEKHLPCPEPNPSAGKTGCTSLSLTGGFIAGTRPQRTGSGIARQPRCLFGATGHRGCRRLVLRADLIPQRGEEPFLDGNHPVFEQRVRPVVRPPLDLDDRSDDDPRWFVRRCDHHMELHTLRALVGPERERWEQRGVVGPPLRDEDLVLGVLPPDLNPAFCRTILAWSHTSLEDRGYIPSPGMVLSADSWKCEADADGRLKANQMHTADARPFMLAPGWCG